MSQEPNLIQSLTPKQFVEIFAASPREAKERLWHAFRIRAPKTRGFAKVGAKNQVRTEQLFTALRDANNDEVAHELVFNWLLTKRPMLAAALDHMQISHKDGLSDSDDVKQIAKLAPEKLRELHDVLLAKFPKDEIELYLRYIGVDLSTLTGEAPPPQ